jgi:hypothetical protein
MKTLALLAATAALCLVAGCNPADSVSEAYADVHTVSFAPLWPSPAADAQVGTIHEYY